MRQPPVSKSPSSGTTATDTGTGPLQGPDGQRIATASADRTARVWDAE